VTIEAVSKHQEHADSVVTGFATRLSELASSWHDAATDLDGAHAESEQVVSTLLEACQQHQGACDQQHETVISRIADAVSELENAASAHEEHASALTDSAEQIVQMVQERLETLGAEWAQLRDDTIGEFLQNCSQGLDETEQAFDTTVDTLAGWTEHLAQEVMSRIGDVMDQFRVTAGADVEAGLTQTFADTRQAFEGAFGSFSDALQECGDHFRDEAETLVNNVIEHAQDKAADEIKSAFDELVKDALEHLASEVVEHVATMQAGVATTTGIAPILPQLMAAKCLLGAINNFMAALEGETAG
jgi:hypothetical protein